MRSRWRIVIREWVLKPFATVHLALMDQLAMNRTVKFTRLRLGTSILLLASCLLLAVLWVHSYWWRDSLVASLPGVHSAFIESDAGEMRIAIVPAAREWNLMSKEQPSRLGANTLSYQSGSAADILPWGTMIAVPHWYLMLVTAVIAGIPWMRWRSPSRTRTQLAVIGPQYGRSLESAA